MSNSLTATPDAKSQSQPGQPVEIAPTFTVPSRDPPAQRRLSTRHRRPALVAFVNDAGTESALCDGLAAALPGGVDVRRGGIQAAIVSMRKATTPSVLIVDIGDEDQPLIALAHLADVVEPDVCVLVVGNIDSVDFFHEVTVNLGAQDYLAKPLTTDKVARHFGALVAGRAPVADGAQGGGLVIITGVSGGVGATTLAVNLAGHFGVALHRHTVILDPDLHLGDASMLLNIKPGPGLLTALQAPERIDALLAERAAQPVIERLHVLAGDEPLTTKLTYTPGAAAKLVAALRRRYNLIVADVPFGVPLYDELLELAHQRVLVMLPTLTSVRATLRFLSALPKGEHARHPIIVLNRLGTPGGLTRRQVEGALAMKVDVVVPDQPRQVAAAATVGELAMNGKSGFRTGVLELARHVSFVGLTDATIDLQSSQKASGAWRVWRLFRSRS
jgi:pilus assembly protein CpaE